MKNIDFNDLKVDTILGYGSEGTVYSSGKFAVKTFRCLTENKLEKIKLLAKKKMKNFIFPIDLVTEDNEVIGYTMNKVEGVSLLELLEDENVSNITKKKYLYRAQELIKKAHKKNIILGDLNFENFVISNDELYAIDTDNYKIENYENDILPGYVYPYYAGKINNNISENSDKFLFGINILRHLYRDKFNDGAMIGYCRDYDYINDEEDGLLKELNLHKDLLDYYKKLSMEDEEKEFINEKIMLL